MYVNKTSRGEQDNKENERRYKGNESRDSVKHLIRYKIKNKGEERDEAKSTKR